MRKLFTYLLLFISLIGNTTTYFFSNAGNDGAAGTSSGTAWATLTKFNSFFSSFQPGDIVSFRRGDTFLGSMTISRSGSSGNPITITAYGSGAKPIISGFTTISSWTSIGGGLYETTLAAGLSTCNMIVFNGAFQAIGRWPKVGAVNSGYLTFQSHNAITSITSNAISGALSYVGGEVVIRKVHWILDRGLITGQTSTTVTYNGCCYTPVNGYGFFFQNHPNACTVLGDWSYNSSSHKVTMFFGGGGPGANVVKASTIDNLVSISGRSWITFDNLAFQGSNSKTFNISSSNNLRINACDLSFAGINGIVTSSSGSNTISLLNSTISYTNNNAIVANESTAWTIQDNVITNTGMIAGMGQSGDGAYFTVQDIGNSSLLEHNEIGNCGYLGINFSGSNVTIQNNYIHDFCMVKDDGAAIYTGRTTVYTNRKILNNIVVTGGSDVSRAGTNGEVSAYAIYVDQGSQNVEIRGNTGASCVGGGVHLNSASNIQVLNNTFFDNVRNFDYTTYSEPTLPINNVTQTGNIFFAKQTTQLCGWAYSRNGSTVSMWGNWNNNHYCRPILEPNGINVGGSYGVGNTSGVLQLVTEGGNGTRDYSLDVWKTITSQDAASVKTPITVNNVNKIRFEYNATQSATVVSLVPNTYMDVFGTVYSTSITLQPYTSAILLQTTAVNIPPIVDAGPDQTITLPTNSVTMAGSATDPDGSVSSHTWTKTVGGAATITTASSYTTTITGLVAGGYTFQLSATDNSGATTTQTMNVTVNAAANLPPVAGAGTDKNITLPTNTVTQVGSASDPDGTVAGVLWTRLSGPATFNIVSPTQTTTVINNLVQGTYVFNIRVTDNVGATANDQMTLVVNPAVNQPPIANAGGNKNITLPTNSVTQVGSGTDPDGTIASYLWTKTSGPATFNIVSPTSATTVINNLVAGTYTFQLQVTDNQGATAVNTATVVVNPAPPVNIPPIANAGTDKNITLPTNSVTQVGSGSDADGTVTGYAWTKISGPASSTIVSPSASTTVINNLVQGTYVFQLQVTDNQGATGTDQMSIIVNPVPNTPPVAGAGTDQVITLPTTTTAMAGTASDPGGSIASTVWSQIGGTASTITNVNSLTTSITGLSTAGSRTYRLLVTDNLGLTDDDTVIILVNPAPNQPPVSNAGTDKVITLPTNSVTQVGSASDPDGTVAGVLWTKVSGPASSNIVSATQTTTVINNLTQGTYIFNLRVTDNSGAFTSDQMTITVNAALIAPTANAGGNQSITLPTSSVTLTGSGTDPDGTIVSYAWTKISGPAGGTITSPSSAITTVTGYTNAGNYVYQLVVTDNSSLTGSSTTQVTVIAANIPPTANAGANQTITLPTSSVTLTGSGNDPDGTISAYAWVKISGPAGGLIASPSSAVTSVTGYTNAGTYVYRLTVTDNGGLTGSSTTQIIVNSAPPPNLPPVVDAGTDKVLTLPTNSVSQVGSATDPDGTVVSYAWTKISGPAATINSPTAATTTLSNLVQGTYIFQLAATDNQGAVGTDQTTVTVNSAPNIPPVANAGTDKNITLPTNSVSQVGSGTDADGVVTTYQWTKISGPATFNIVSPALSTTTINNLVQGTYIFQLQVTDNNSASGTDQATIVVNAAPNTPPIAGAGVDQVITLPTATATMAGTASDPGGSVASTLWTQIGGTASTITNSASLTTTITGLSSAGSRTYKLLVTDNLGLTASDTMIILVNPAANVLPVSSAGSDQNDTLPITSMTLTGSGTDADGTITGYLWTQVSGPSGVVIVSQTQPVTQLTNWNFGGIYIFNLRVTDNVGATANDQVTLTIDTLTITPPPVWIPPTSNAGVDKKAVICVFCGTVSTTVTGSGASTYGIIVGYQWTKISGPSGGTLSSPNTATTNISGLVRGTYVYQLQVTDNQGFTGTDTMIVTVTKNYIVIRRGRIIIIEL